MKKRTRTLRSDLLAKVALLSLTAGMLTACSSYTERFGDGPIYTGGTDNQRAILGSDVKQPSYKDIVNGPGGTSAGLPPVSSQPVHTGSIPRQTRSPASAVQSAPLPAPAPATPRAAAPVVATPQIQAAAPQAATPAGISWKGWTSVGGTRVPVRQGETVSSLSRRYGVPQEAVQRVNGLDDPAEVQVGQTIIIPTYVYGGGTTTRVDDSGRPVRLPSATAQGPVTTGSVPQVVASRGTVPSPDPKPYQQPSFADVSSGRVPAAETTPIQVVSAPRRKPAGYSGSNAQLTTASISQTAPVPRAEPGRTGSSIETALAVPESRQTEARPTAPIGRPEIVASIDPVDTNAPRFRWPVRGRIISDFGPKTGGERNDGVNLAVPEGTPVKAADDGTVIYSGNELKGYGNLILLRHDEGWVTAYAHNSELKVKRGDAVRRGDVVGLAGATGSVTQPQVHFELRQGNKPVDPLKYLPKS